ncbi:MAG: class I SAM-dependent rRNA methyltransferase [Bacteroidia bacterium]
MYNYKRVILKKDKERSLLNFHPWVFSGAIAKQDNDIEDGDVVEVFSDDQKYLATGHLNKGSITVRLLLFEQKEIDENFWIEKLNAALEVRKQLGLVNSETTNVYRLIHGEGDGLPGLIIDIYNKAAVIQCHSIGMYRSRKMIAECLHKVFKDELTTIYDKSADTLHNQNQLKVENDFLLGNEASTVVKENNIMFEVNWVEGQKTGFFIDQRENRQLLQHYSKNKKVLNTFAYSGGFSLYALKGGASMVHSVDSSKKATEAYQKNVLLNQEIIADDNEIEIFFTSDVFNFMKQSEGNYDMIILDPPAFAKHLDAVKKAAIAYRNLNYDAFRRINKNGIVFTFSCSQAIDKTLFRKIIFAAAAMSKRHVRILHQLTQPADHPISIYHPEGEYLKGLVLHVE